MTQRFWWSSSKVRPVWVEITRRPNDDIGIDLNHNTSSPRPYRLLAEPSPGDRVLHWDSKRQQFVGASQVLRKHRDSGRNRSVVLSDFRGFPSGSLTLEMIQEHGSAIGRIRAGLDSSEGPLYFPFAPYGSAGWRRVRPALAYLSAAPPELVSLLGGIYETSRRGNLAIASWTSLGLRTPQRVSPTTSQLDPAFRRYLEANEGIAVSPQNEERLRDDKALQAAYRQHNAVQNTLARWLQAKGLVPESQRAMDRYPVDIQWRAGRRLFVAEVKSLSKNNELSQMRRGLGQVLHYRYLAATQHPGLTVVPVLIVPSAPSDRTAWESVCRDAGVILTWPSTFKRLLLDK